MGNEYATAVLVLAALFGAATCWLSGARPERFAQSLGLTVANAGGLNEVRAQYAGFFLAVTAVCLAAVGGLAPRSAALIVLIVVFGGLISSRLLSLVLNRGFAGFSPTIRSLYVIDSIGLLLSTTALLADRG